MRWTRLPETPNAPGFGGAFVGTSGDLLLCGGGSNFPDKPAWDGGVKVWHDEVFSLASTRSKKWASLGKLPRPCGYGVSVSIRQGLLMIGGADSHRHYADCYTLSVEEGELKVRPFPFLPRPLAYATGALVERLGQHRRNLEVGDEDEEENERNKCPECSVHGAQAPCLAMPETAALMSAAVDLVPISSSTIVPTVSMAIVSTSANARALMSAMRLSAAGRQNCI